MRSFTFLLFPLAIHLAIPFGLAGQSNVQSEVRSKLEDYVRATNAGDIETLAGLYLDSPGTSSAGDGRIYRGWATVSDLLRGIYDQMGWVELQVSELEITPLGPASALATFIATWRQGSDPATRHRGAMTIVFLLTDEGWKVAHEHTSTLPGSTVIEPPQRPALSLMSGGPTEPVREPESCEVTRIVDGDTIECAPFGRVRLIGMDTPEGEQQPYGDMATQALAAMIPTGSDVLLEPDVEAHDDYGRVLGYVWVDGMLVNWALVRQGYAVLLTYPPNVQYVDWLSSAQSAAREDEAGLWAIDGFACPPVDFRRGRCRKTATDNSGRAIHSLSLVALRAIHLRSRRLRRQAPRPPVMSAAREALGGVRKDHAPAPPEVERRFP